MMSVPVHEVFASVQGEGPWVGQRHIFVRFMGCDIACRYCDTPAAQTGGARGPGSEFLCRAQRAPDSLDYETLPLNISAHQLSGLCSRLIIPGPGRPVLSITGGEPLLHHEFLSRWLPEAKNIFTVYLETSGVHHRGLTEVLHMVDVISMDFKLPSATCLRPFWTEHEKFLAAARAKIVFVKAVVTADTTVGDILRSAALIAECGEALPLVIQPATGPLAPAPALLIAFQNAALGLIPDVRVIPQAHRVLMVP